MQGQNGKSSECRHRLPGRVWRRRGLLVFLPLTGASGCFSLYLGDDPQAVETPGDVTSPTLEPTQQLTPSPTPEQSPSPDLTPTPTESPVVEPSPDLEPTPTLTPLLPDQDGDGYNVEADCNDADSAIHPGAAELCDGSVDEDCDEEVDEGCVDPCSIYDLSASLQFFDAQGKETSSFHAGEPVTVLAGLINGCAGPIDVYSEDACFVMTQIVDDRDDVVLASPMACGDAQTLWTIEPGELLSYSWIWFQVDESGKQVKADDSYVVQADFVTGALIERVVMISACGSSDEVSCENSSKP